MLMKRYIYMLISNCKIHISTWIYNVNIKLNRFKTEVLVSHCHFFLLPCSPSKYIAHSFWLFRLKILAISLVPLFHSKPITDLLATLLTLLSLSTQNLTTSHQFHCYYRSPTHHQLLLGLLQQPLNWTFCFLLWSLIFSLLSTQQPEWTLKNGRQICHSSAQKPQWLPISWRVKGRVLTVAYKVLYIWPPVASLTSVPTTLPLTNSTWPKLAFLQFINIPSMLLPHNFCNHCSLCQEFSFPRYPCGSFLHLPIFAQMSPFQRVLLCPLYLILSPLYTIHSFCLLLTLFLLPTAFITIQLALNLFVDSISPHGPSIHTKMQTPEDQSFSLKHGRHNNYLLNE